MIKEFFIKKSIGFYLMCAAALCALFGIITYSAAGLDTGYGAMIIVMLALTVIAGAAFGVKDFFKCGSIIVSILSCIAIGIFFNARFIYFSYVYYGVGEETSLSAAMVMTLIFFAGMLLTSITSAFFKQEKEAGR